MEGRKKEKEEEEEKSNFQKHQGTRALKLSKGTAHKIQLKQGLPISLPMYLKRNQ